MPNQACPQPEAIDLKRGQVITLADRSGNWWRGTVDGKTGKFPSNYVALTKDAVRVPRAYLCVCISNRFCIPDQVGGDPHLRQGR